MKEALFQQAARVSIDFTQPWGSVDATLSGSSYLHDLSKNNVSFNTGLNLRLLRGFQVRIHGNVSAIHDQLSIPNKDAPIEDVLLRRQELETQFSYFGFLSLSYTFGSKFNNIVNPRFGSGERIFFMIM